MDEAGYDEAGNELSSQEIAELRRDGHAPVSNAPEVRDPVLTRSRARAALVALALTGGDTVERVWGQCVSVTPPSISREVFLSYCYVVKRSARRGMREVSAERAASLDFQLAKQKELASWDACGVYDLVPDEEQKYSSCPWVLVNKVLDDGSIKPKARLVVRRFQDRDVQDVDTFSPTCSKSSWRAVLVVAAYRGWAPVAIDISTAFLQGGALEREVYVGPPAELHAPGKLLRLRKAVYGLVVAPLHWYQVLHAAMLQIGAREIPLDPAIYLFFYDARICSWAAVHVDDIPVAGTRTCLDTVLGALYRTFPVGAEKGGEYVYCAVHLRTVHGPDGELPEITLDQEKWKFNWRKLLIVHENSMKRKRRCTED